MNAFFPPISAIAIMLSTLAACAGSSTRVDKPVVIDKPDAKSRLALQNAVSKSLGAAYVVLPDDALTRDSVLTIDPARVREFEGRRLQGREARAPELFRLVRGNKKEECVLIQDRTHLRMTLPDTHCKPK